ncbi:hypothetical protein RVX_R04040 [Nitratidesulfovibrio sp. HK-II]|uniref:hypothetical protein n=1 Tax=Nitratidesulfovibrio sp. HK-II TaxID=2009266 RepID=UPI000ED1D11B|nr:hypothetical protein [Nitratidesulfovibrio sp. HK-II]GBO96988.1 hypothetical protein RVX_2027 [Nitratidesulfovibrio sp. HK-II]
MSPTDDAHLTADEDIIELTDIIEKGTAPQAQPGSDAASFEKELEDLFSDGGGLESLKGFDSLDADIPPPVPADSAASAPDDSMDAGPGAGPGADMDASMDADIDALLNSIGDLPDTPEPAPAPRPAPATAAHNDAEEATSMSAKPVSSTPSAITGRPVDPDEELRMPDMTDVDALLGDLGAPTAADLTSGGAGRTMGDDDIDDLIAGLDAKAPATPAATAPPASTEQAAPQKPADMVDVADLDALLEDMLGSGPKAAPAPEPAPAAPEELDPFEAALAASAAQPSVAPPDEPPADGDPFEAALAAAATAAAIAAPESPRPAPKAAPVAAAAHAPDVPSDIPMPGGAPDTPDAPVVPEAPESPESPESTDAPDAGDTPAGYAARIEALEGSLAALAERNDEERAAREALETRLSAIESLADAAPSLSEDSLAALLEPLLAREDGPFAPLLERVRAALVEDLEARIEEHLAPLRDRAEAAPQAEGVTRADLDMMAADLRTALLAETDKAAASAAARIIREEIAALAEAL